MSFSTKSNYEGFLQRNHSFTYDLSCNLKKIEILPEKDQEINSSENSVLIGNYSKLSNVIACDTSEPNTRHKSKNISINKTLKLSTKNSGRIKKLWKCSNCDHTNIEKSNIKKHIERTHSIIKKKYICTVAACGASFHDPSRLTWHKNHDHKSMTNTSTALQF
jgi:hypothetical protein